MRRGGDDANGSASEAGSVEVYLGLAGRDLVHGDELLSRRGEGHPQCFSYTGPALGNCLGEPRHSLFGSDLAILGEKLANLSRRAQLRATAPGMPKRGQTAKALQKRRCFLGPKYGR